MGGRGGGARLVYLLPPGVTVTQSNIPPFHRARTPFLTEDPSATLTIFPRSAMFAFIKIFGTLSLDTHNIHPVTIFKGILFIGKGVQLVPRVHCSGRAH